MSPRNIIIEPDPILRKKSEPLEQVNNDTRKLIDDMLQTMYAAPGIGLAAVQVGILKRLIIISIPKEDDSGIYCIKQVLVNPEIFWCSKSIIDSHEGCLSFEFVVVAESCLKDRFLN